MAEGGGTDGNGDGGRPKSPDLTNKQNEQDDNMDGTPKDNDATGPKVAAAVNYHEIPLSPLKQKPLHNERPKRQTVASAAARAQIPEDQMNEMILGLR